jgi:hypothetical protein
MTLMEVHEFTAKRLGTTQGAAGGQIRSFTVANRGALPRKFKGRAVIMKEKERLEHGIRGDFTAWKVLTPSDPKLDLTDQLVFDYVSGQSHTLKVIVASKARSHDAKFYRTICEEDTSES